MELPCQKTTSKSHGRAIIVAFFTYFVFFAVLYVHNAPLGTGFMHTFVRTTQEPHSHEGDIVVEWQKYYKGLSWNFSVHYLGSTVAIKNQKLLRFLHVFLASKIRGKERGNLKRRNCLPLSLLPETQGNPFCACHPREVPRARNHILPTEIRAFLCWQLSRIIQETPDFGPYPPVSRLESDISRIIAKIAISCRHDFPTTKFQIFCVVWATVGTFPHKFRYATVI